MASNNFKNPPTLGEKSYHQWRNEVAAWQLMTDVAPNKQALAIALSLQGKAREAAFEITGANLNAASGVTELLAKLDEIFKKATVEETCAVYHNFESFKRGEQQSISDYIIEFERLYNKTRRFDVVLPEVVLAYKLLEGANLSQTDKQLTLSGTNDLKFDEMKKSLRRIFSSSLPATLSAETTSFDHNVPGPVPQIKEEPIWYAGDRRRNFSKPQSRFNNNGMNPLKNDGTISRCSICESVYHWARYCPDKGKKPWFKRTRKPNEIFSLQLDSDNYQEVLNETLTCAILDTGCSRTVCGQLWFEDYVAKLSDIDKVKILYEKSNVQFKFGVGHCVPALYTARIPVTIGKTPCFMNCDVIEKNVPLLLSKKALKDSESQLDLKNDIVTMFDEHLKLETTSNGHYYINLLPTEDLPRAGADVFSAIDIEEKLTNKKDLIRLHRQFGHASSEKLKGLIKNAGVCSKNVFKLLDEVCNECKTCMIYKKPPLKPKVSLPWATNFNQMVAMDLHELGPNLWYVHFIDHFTRLSAAAIITNKTTQEIIKQFFEKWISIYGPPELVLSDNGGEFNSAAFRDMAENLNIEIRTTPAYSPWSNGLVERHNAILTTMLQKIKSSENVSWDIALSWSIFAKNSLQNVQGFSPFQLVFGKNPNFHSNLFNREPAHGATSMSQVVADNLKSIHAARQAFIETESSTRIRKAFQHNVSNSEENLITGDKVYFKKANESKWKGPGVVIGCDGCVVFIRQGGVYLRVHKCMVQRVCNFENELNANTKNLTSNTTETDNNEFKFYSASTDTEDINEFYNEESDDEENENITTPTNSSTDTTEIIDFKPTKGMLFKFDIDNVTHKAKILSRRGKAGGKYSDWYNIEFIAPESKVGEKISINITECANKSNISDDDTEKGAHNSINEEQVFLNTSNLNFDEAKLSELESWKKNNVYEVVQNEGPTISTRWVCTMKETINGLIPKARLVIRGFEEDCIKSLKTDSPTCSKEGLRIILSLAAQQHWTPKSIDIKTAFLQGKSIDRKVYIMPPKICNSDNLWLLNKCVYGLADASFTWYCN